MARPIVRIRRLRPRWPATRVPVRPSKISCPVNPRPPRRPPAWAIPWPTPPPVSTGVIRPLGGTDTTGETPALPGSNVAGTATSVPLTADLRTMMNPIVPHGPPIRPELPGDTSSNDDPETDGKFGCSLSNPALTTGATALAPQVLKERDGVKAVAARQRETRDTSDTSSSPDVAAMVAQLPPTLDLRALTPAITLAPDLTGSRSEKPSVTSAASGSEPASSALQGGSVQPRISAEGNPSPATTPGLPSGTARVAEAGQMTPSIPATAHPADRSPTKADGSAGSSIGDPRQAASTPAIQSAASAEAGGEISESSAKEAAKIAGSTRDQTGPAPGMELSPSQPAGNEGVINDVKTSGTTVARDVTVVNATQTSNTKEKPASAPAKRGEPVSVGSTGAGRSADIRHSYGPALTSLAVAGVARAEVLTAQAATPTAADTSAAQQAVKIETLLQNALSAGESLRPDGQGQMEMRVKLDGGTGDVTVRMQVVNDQMQVTFQTNSPELSKALEHGWQQFSASAAQTTTLSLAAPRFESGQFGGVAGGRSDTPSSNQQNAHRQDASTASPDESTPTTASRRPGSTSSAAASLATGSTGRWTGWA